MKNLTMNTNLLGLMLATSLTLGSLAGCVVMPTGVKNAPGTATSTPTNGGTMTGTKPAPTTSGNATTNTPATVAPLAPAKQQTAASSSSDTAAALAEEQEASDYSAVAESGSGPAAYTVQMVGAEAAGEGMVAITSAVGGDADGEEAGRGGKRAGGRIHIKADILAKLEAHKTARLARAEARLGGAKDKIKNAAAGSKWVANDDGTSTKTLTVDVTRGGNSRHVSIELIKNADGVIISSKTERSMTNGGGSHSLKRSKVVAEDGTATIHFETAHTFKNGNSRLAVWDKTVTADGVVSGTGTITWSGTKTKVITITLGGTEETETAAAKDGDVVTTVSATADGAVTATATDDTGATADVKIEAPLEDAPADTPKADDAKGDASDDDATTAEASDDDDDATESETKPAGSDDDDDTSNDIVS